jgi:nucleotide-binding universal stress UspA family protein
MSEKHDNGPILVPIDFSAMSEAALVLAMELGHCLKRPVLALHVVHDPSNMPGYYGKALKQKHLTRIEDGAAEMLNEFLERVAKAHEDHFKHGQVDSMLVKGLPTSRILEVAKKSGAEMIVVGSKGMTGWKHLMIGSVAEQVVHLAEIPVTVVKSYTKKRG